MNAVINPEKQPLGRTTSAKLTRETSLRRPSFESVCGMFSTSVFQNFIRRLMLAKHMSLGRDVHQSLVALTPACRPSNPTVAGGLVLLQGRVVGTHLSSRSRVDFHARARKGFAPANPSKTKSPAFAGLFNSQIAMERISRPSPSAGRSSRPGPSSKRRPRAECKCPWRRRASPSPPHPQTP